MLEGFCGKRRTMKPTYSNDRSAPRMRKAEFSKSVITNELFKKFKKEFPEYKDLTWKEFYQCWLNIAKKIREQVVQNPLGVKLGSYLGEIKLQYIPYKFKAVNHWESIKVGEKIPYLNIETKGKVPRIKWERRQAVKFNKILQFYAFDETREVKKLAAEYIRNDNADKIRTARVTIGGHSVWRQKFKKQ